MRTSECYSSQPSNLDVVSLLPLPLSLHTVRRNKLPAWKLRASFKDHTLGVQALSYLRGTLLSAGFDWEVIAWDAERLEKIGTMTGHKAPVTAVAQVHMVCIAIMGTPQKENKSNMLSVRCNLRGAIPWSVTCSSGGSVCFVLCARTLW